MAKKKKKRVEEADAIVEETQLPEGKDVKHDVPHQLNGFSSNEKTKKKKKFKSEHDHQITPKPSAPPTVTIALPGSIIDNAQSLELATRLAGQIARAATIFRVNEVVVFDNKNMSPDDPSNAIAGSSDENESGAAFLVRILRYLETPQYLRKTLFPKHNSLRFVGLLPPLDAPHHLRKHEWETYREGVTLKEKSLNTIGTLVDVGLSKNIVVDQTMVPGQRVTVAMGTNRQLDAGMEGQPREVVSRSKPREDGIYWGYEVRYAPNISSVFSNCPFKGGYDHLIGTSEHGVFLKSSELSLPLFRHLLIAFGGLAGLEECIEEDNNLKGKNVQEVFNLYLNTCPHQGSRTIRTEEAIFISLQYFQEPISRAQKSSNVSVE